MFYERFQTLKNSKDVIQGSFKSIPVSCSGAMRLNPGSARNGPAF
jgi:hypothetical protein